MAHARLTFQPRRVCPPPRCWALARLPSGPIHNSTLQKLQHESRAVWKTPFKAGRQEQFSRKGKRLPTALAHRSMLLNVRTRLIDSYMVRMLLIQIILHRFSEARKAAHRVDGASRKTTRRQDAVSEPGGRGTVPYACSACQVSCADFFGYPIARGSQQVGASSQFS